MATTYDDPLASERLDITFAALSDPTRRAILARLARGDATVNELAGPFDLSLQAVSKHIKVLERGGLVSRARRAQFRPCHLEPAALDAAVTWIEQSRRVWTQRFDQLDAHLREIQAPTAAMRPGAKSTRPRKDAS